MSEAVAATLVVLLIRLGGFARERSDSLAFQAVGEVRRYGGAIVFAAGVVMAVVHIKRSREQPGRSAQDWCARLSRLSLAATSTAVHVCS